MLLRLLAWGLFGIFLLLTTTLGAQNKLMLYSAYVNDTQVMLLYDSLHIPIAVFNSSIYLLHPDCIPSNDGNKNHRNIGWDVHIRKSDTEKLYNNIATTIEPYPGHERNRNKGWDANTTTINSEIPKKSEMPYPQENRNTGWDANTTAKTSKAYKLPEVPEPQDNRKTGWDANTIIKKGKQHKQPSLPDNENRNVGWGISTDVPEKDNHRPAIAGQRNTGWDANMVTRNAPHQETNNMQYEDSRNVGWDTSNAGISPELEITCVLKKNGKVEVAISGKSSISSIRVYYAGHFISSANKKITFIMD